ncbi:hypothetical protein JR316_0005924 [Psilocybe cubensis]|uniref:Uncharacterized protein n=2 Tax=Psilocybe cubensis TaxID=181762 RepID=A0ACB8H068_PSICU|nr:hypothetical protein JR316_0005924 [Psilocybe cubensis]KAH9481398.1 hypothetical protein JR316_0005924 [Psilocybe cubensis]
MYSTFLFVALAVASSIALGNARRCDNKHIIDSTPVTMPSGHTITMQRFNCTNDIHEAPKARAAANSLRSLQDKRAASQCTTANCICGVPCFFSMCSATTDHIQAADCTNLANSLINNPATFTIPPGQALAFILNSCEYAAFGTSSTQPTEYCFNDFGVAASEVFHVCGNTQHGSCEGTLNGAPFFVDQL